MKFLTEGPSKDRQKSEPNSQHHGTTPALIHNSQLSSELVI